MHTMELWKIIKQLGRDIVFHILRSIARTKTVAEVTPGINMSSRMALSGSCRLASVAAAGTPKTYRNMSFDLKPVNLMSMISAARIS
uniref:Uncharacterized protein n=1 Tax=Rhizophora mucronata TaxID=61149 RepID=A0A2P2MX51_RHIMU